MQNVSLDRTTILQLDTHRTDAPLNVAADCDILGDHAAVDRFACADQNIGGMQLAFNSTENLSWTIALDIADDRHAGPDTRHWPRFRGRQLGLRRYLIRNCARRLYRSPYEFVCICRRVLIRLNCLALEAIQHVNLPS